MARTPMPDLMTIPEAALALRVSKPTVYRMAEDRVLKSYDFAGKRGKRYLRIYRDSLLDFIEANTIEAKKPRKGQKGYEKN